MLKQLLFVLPYSEFPIKRIGERCVLIFLELNKYVITLYNTVHVEICLYRRAEIKIAL